MTIEAELADGRILEFPDGTKPEVIQGVVKKLVGGGVPTPATAPTPAPTPTQKGERTWGEAATDIGASAVSGLGQLAQFPGQLYGLATGAIKDKDFATTGMQGVGKEMQDWAKAQKSAELKRREAETEKKVREAEKTGGWWAAFKTQLYESGTDPMQLGSLLVETAPASIPSIIAALIPGAGPGLAAEVRALQLAARAATTEVAKQAAEQALGVALKEAAKSAVKRGTAASVGVGAVQQGTDVGVGAYKQVYDTLIAKGVPPEQAAEQTINKARAAGVAGAVISLLAQRLPGAQAMERALAGEKGKLGRVAGAVVGGVKESPGEIFEEVGGKGVQNVAARTVNPEQSLTAGLGQTAAQAGLGGFGMGSTVGALQGRQTPEAPAAPAAPSLSPQTRDADYEPPLFAATTPQTPPAAQQARQERVAQRTQELAQIIGNEEDAARLAEDEVAAEEERNRKMAAGPTDTAVKTRAQELVASGMEPNQAYAAATQQIADELENDALAKEQGALDVAGTKPKPSRKRTRVASKPGAETTGGPEAPARDGVVPAGADVGLPNAGERLEPGALTESQPVVTEGAPSGTETVEAKQAKAKKQEAPATPVAQGVKVDVAAAAAATDPAEIQKHLADIEAEGATLLSKDGRFPKKGTTKRVRLDELGQLKRQLTEKLAPAPVAEEPVAETPTPAEETKVEEPVAEPTREEDDKKLKQLIGAVDRAKKQLLKDENLASDDPKLLATRERLAKAKAEYEQFSPEIYARDLARTKKSIEEFEARQAEKAKAETPAAEEPASAEPPKAEKPKRQRKPKAVEEPKADIAIEPEVSPPSKGVVNAFEAAKRRIPMGPSISEQIAEEEAKEKADRKKVKDFEAAEKERKAEEDRIAKEEKATAEEQAAAEAAERDEAAKARAGGVDTVPLEKQIAGALQEIIDSPRFAPDIRKDAKRHLDTITKSAKDPESDAHEAGLEMAYNFVVAQASKPRFMRQGKKPRPSIGRAKVVAIIEAIKARWKNAPEVVVVENINDPAVPTELQEADREAVARGATGVPAGVFYKGKVYIFADQMTSTKDVVETLLHEALGHYGLRGVFGKGLKPILEQVARDFPKEMQALKEKYGLDYSKPKDVAEAAEEILANLAATKPTMGIVQRAIAAVRRALRSIGLDLKLSNNDLIANYILPARSFVEGERVNRAVGGNTSFSRTEEGDEDFDVSEEEVAGAVRSQKEVDLAVKRAEFKFEESAKAQKAAKGVSAAQMAQDPRKALPLVRQMWNRATAAQRRLMVKLPPTSFLVNWVQKEVPQLQATYKLMQKMAGMTNGLLKTAGELTNEIERAFRADPTLRDKLDKITSVATLAEVDPATIDTAERSERLDTLWRELGPEGQRVYKRIRDHFDGLSKYLSKLLDDQVASSNLGVIDQANLMKKIRAVFEQGGKINPYFPLVREGNFWLAMNPNKSKNAADYMFFMAESAAERDNVAREYAADQLRRKAGETEAAWNKRIDDKLKELESDRVFERGDNIQALRDKPYSQGGNKMLTDVFNAIDGMDLGSPNANDALKDSIYQAFLETMPDQAFRKQFIHRKGVAGFRVDVLRNVAHTSAKMATQLARIKYSPMLRNALSAAEDSIAGRLEFEPFVNEMKERVDAAIAPPQQSTASDIANGLNKASFIYYLSGASSALLQPLSIFQTGLPVLSRYGAFNAAKEVAGMMKVWNQVGFHKTNADGTKSWVMPSMEHAKGLTPQQRRAYKAAEAMDLFTATQASAVFNYKATPTDKLRSPKMKLAKGTVDALIFGGLMNTSEKLSREAMFMASFNLNMKEHGNFSRAVDQAVMDTNAALGNYGDYNRPAFMNGLGGKVLTQFMMYPLHTASFLVTNFKTMVAPMGGKDRAEAAQRFFGSLGTTFILAGAAGLPMFSTVMGMLGAAWGQMKDDDWPEDVRDMDFELWFRTKCLDDLLGGLAPVFERGVANAITGVDVAGRTGWGNLFSRDTKETATLREGLTASILEHAGPSANMILSMADGVDAARQGDYAKAVKKWAPAGFRNFINAHELATQGAKDNKGAQVLAKDSFNTGLLIGQSIGFRSDLLTNTQYVAFKVIGLEKRILNERTQILNNLDREYRNGNSAGYVKYLKERQEFNNRYPTYEITPDNVADSLETRAEQRATSWRGVLPSEKNVGVFAPVLAPALRAAAKAEEEGRKK